MCDLALLCVLEKLVHVEDPAILPELVMITYELPDSAGIEEMPLDALPADWRRHEAWSQQKGDAWHDKRSTLLLRVPSAIVPILGAPDLNVLINHSHPAIADVRILSREPFLFDPRLF